MLRFFTRNMLTGLVTILPIFITLYLIYWFIVSTESLLGSIIRNLLPKAYYWPGMGVLVALVIVFLIGLLTHIYVVKTLFSKVERLLYHTPIIKTIYGSFRDFFHYFSSSREKDFQQVVTVTFDNGMQLLGFMTQSNTDALPAGMANPEQDSVLVYLPMSYMIGGYAVVLPRSMIREMDISMEEAMRFTLTAGVALRNGQ